MTTFKCLFVLADSKYGYIKQITNTNWEILSQNEMGLSTQVVLV